VPPSPIIEDDQEDNSYHVKQGGGADLTPPELMINKPSTSSSMLNGGISLQKVVNVTRPESAVLSGPQIRHV
jgi:hypothetical protein